MSELFDFFSKLLAFWRGVLLLCGMFAVLLGLLGLTKDLPLTAAERWQVPLLGIIMVLASIHWLSGAPPKEGAPVAFELVPEGNEPRTNPIIYEIEKEVNAVAASEKRKVYLLRITGLSALPIETTLHVKPLYTPMKLHAATLILLKQDDKIVSLKAEMFGRDLCVKIDNTMQAAAKGYYVMLNLSDDPFPSTSQLPHLIKLTLTGS